MSPPTQESSSVGGEMLIRLESSSHVSQLTKQFEELLLQESMVDVVLVTEEEQFIHAHKIILASGSLYFKKIIESTCKLPAPSSPIIICLSDIKYAHLYPLIKYIYTGRVDIPQSELKSLVKTAFQLKIIGLYEEEQAGSSTVKTETNETPEEVVHNDLEAFIKEEEEEGDVGEEEEEMEDDIDHDQFDYPLGASVQIDEDNPDQINIEGMLEQNMSGSQGARTSSAVAYPYTCPKCGKGYTCSKSLWRHKKYTCSDRKVSFVCNICSKIFSRSDNLRRHSLVAHHFNGT